MSGAFSWLITPYCEAIVDAIFEKGIRGIRCQKSAQVGWSESVLCNLIGFFIDRLPASMIVLFPKLEKGKEFNIERFEPMVEETQVLSDKVQLTRREKGVTQFFKSFAGGWLKFIGSHSADSVKSSSARYVFVEEPDDCDSNVKGQGSTIKLLRERLKTYYDTLSIMGGTPTLKKLSAIEDEMELTDKRQYYVPCHHCEAPAPLEWANVKWLSDDSLTHPVYGKALPDSAYYACASCGGAWTDAEKNRNVRRARELQKQGVPGVGWVATAPFTGLAGFYLNDLVSAFPGAALAELVRKYLEAVHKANAGDVFALIEFWNNQLGLAFEYKSPAPEPEELEKRAEDYAEFTVPWGGLRLSAGVDVQGNRLAIVIVAWGRGEESWRVYWGEIYGNPVDELDPVWAELESFLFRPYKHASGAELLIEGATVDSSDGNTNDAVYKFCRKHRTRGVMAGKGNETGEIYRPAHPVDPRGTTKAARYGLQVFPVGTEKAKDLLIGFGEHGGRLRLSEKKGDQVVTGNGPGRMHWYRGIRSDYFTGVTAEIKAPKKGRPRNKLYWQEKPGVRNEPLDCEVYALHASRSPRMKVNLMSEAQWAALEQRLRQPDLIGAATVVAPAPAPIPEHQDEPQSEVVAVTADAASAKSVNKAEAAPRPRPKSSPWAQIKPDNSQPGGPSGSSTPY